MFLIFGLLLICVFAGLALLSLQSALRAYSDGKTQQAFVKGLPAFTIVAMVGVGLIYSGYQAEANPEKIFALVFEASPPETVTALRASHDGNEPSPTYLQFTAPPPTVAALLKGKFSLNAAATPQTWGFPPGWFDTSVQPTTQIYRREGVTWQQEAVLLYDPSTNQVRYYAS